MFRTKLLFGFLFAAAFFLVQQSVFACSCGTNPTISDDYDYSNLVVAVKAVSFVKNGKNEKDFRKNISAVKMVVEKVYKGDAKVGDEILIGQDNGGGFWCAWEFDEKAIGEKFLFYLDNRIRKTVEMDENSRPIYYVSFCGKSNFLKYAANDLLYLDNMDKFQGRTRISGNVKCREKFCFNIENVEVGFIGENKTFTAKTDKNGFYEIYDLPAGFYLIEPNLPSGWKAWRDYYHLLDISGYAGNYDEYRSKETQPNQFYFHLSDKGHIEFDIYPVPDNKVSGKVLSPDGKPLPKVCVSAVRIQETEEKYNPYNCTNEKGEFLIESLAPGQYLLTLNNDGKISSDEPFGKTFYPGTAERKNAKTVSVETGKVIDGLSIKIPKTEELIIISRRFLYSDGNPVAKDEIHFTLNEKDERFEEKLKAPTDEQGRFTIKVPKNANGSVFGEMLIFQTTYKNCPEASKALELTGETNAHIKTNKIGTLGNKALTDVKLILPFPKCEMKTY